MPFSPTVLDTQADTCLWRGQTTVRSDREQLKVRPNHDRTNSANHNGAVSGFLGAALVLSVQIFRIVPNFPSSPVESL